MDVLKSRVLLLVFTLCLITTRPASFSAADELISSTTTQQTSMTPVPETSSATQNGVTVPVIPLVTPARSNERENTSSVPETSTTQSELVTVPVIPLVTPARSIEENSSSANTKESVPLENNNQGDNSPQLSTTKTTPTETTSTQAESSTSRPKNHHEVVPHEIFTMEAPETTGTTVHETTTTPLPPPEPKPTTTEKPRDTVAVTKDLEPINATSNEIIFDNNSTMSSENMTEIDIDDKVLEDRSMYLIFKGGECDSASTRTALDIGSYEEVIENGLCTKQLVLKFQFDDDLAKDQMSLLVGKLGLNYDDTLMRLSAVNATYQHSPGPNDTWVDKGETFYVGRLSYIEFVAYVVIASCFGSAVLVASCLLCLKCCRCRDKNDSISRDIPHLTLRLEDYALTRIPRPNTVYSESSKSPIMIPDDASTLNASVRGMGRSTDSQDGIRLSRAYETDVVPMNDYEEHYATPNYLNGVRDSSNELRTFRRQRADHQQVPPKPPRGGEMVETTQHVNGFNDATGGSVTDSTEKLARDFYRRKGGGEENPIYKT